MEFNPVLSTAEKIPTTFWEMFEIFAVFKNLNAFIP
jgi:hypothetical protein